MPSLQTSLARHPTLKQPKSFDPQAFLASAGIGGTLCQYKPKQNLFSQGERANSVFYIRTGAVRLSVVSQQGKEATLSLLGPGDFLGEGCLAPMNPSAWQPLRPSLQPPA